ncbi:MAG: zeta toxin family protein [Sulfobacillus sp.]
MPRRYFTEVNPYPCGRYDEEDRGLYQEIVRAQLRDSRPASPSGPAPLAILLAGPPAVGKTTVIGNYLRSVREDPDKFAVLSVDDIMERLPQYQRALDLRGQIFPDIPADRSSDSIVTAKSAADDCRDLARTIMRHMLEPQVLEERRDFIYDTTARNVSYYVELIDDCRRRGYRVVLLFVIADIRKVIERSRLRAQIDGRYLSEDLMRYIWQALSRRDAFKRLCRIADNCLIYDNQGVRPVIAAEKSEDGRLDCFLTEHFNPLVDPRICGTKI